MSRRERTPKRLRPRPGNAAVVGSERDLRVLSEIGWLGMLTTGQVERLAFPSRRRAQRRLRCYLDQGLVRAHLQGDAMHRDNLWTLTTAGLAFLASRDVDTRDLKTHRPRTRSPKLRHAVLVRDVAVALLVLETRGILNVSDVRLDTDLAGDPVMRSVGIVPDGYAVLESDGIQQVILWEIVTMKQPVAQVREKLVTYERISVSGPRFFQNPHLRIAVIVESERRKEILNTFLEGRQVASKTSVFSADEVQRSEAFAMATAPVDDGFRPAGEPG